MKYHAAVTEHGSKRAAANALGINIKSLYDGLKREAKRATKTKDEHVVLPKFPAKRPPAPVVMRRLAADMDRKDRREKAERWFPVHVRDRKPIGIMWFGDPHLGTSTNWRRLERDIALCATTPGLYGANVGDSSNNWAGRLARLYADEDISRATERDLVRHFLCEAGITWLVWLMGNHDEWESGAEILRMMDVHSRVPMLDWSAKFEIVFPGKRRVRVHAAHDFPGHSMWNITHGPARAPRMLGSDADLYVCGHKHDWGVQQFEMAERGRCPVAIRARGYKRHDPYAKRHGYQDAEHGCSILTIIDPNAGPAGRVLAFADVDQGARVLAALRGGR